MRLDDDVSAKNDGDYEVYYESIRLFPLIFMDDIFCIATSLFSEQYANHLLEQVIGRKGLKIN